MQHVTYINAGAGSGKTFKLTEILSEKLSGENPEVKPSQVILTTFTKLAAAEFREKARQKVLESDNMDAAAQIDSAAIGTVHSVALSFIKKYWYLFDHGAEVDVISQRDEEFYLSQSLAKIVDRHKAAKGETKDALEIFRHVRDYYNIVDSLHRPDYQFWKAPLRSIVEKMEYFDIDNLDESIRRSKMTLRDVFTGAANTEDTKKQLLGYLQKYYNYINTANSREASKQIKKIRPILSHCDNIYDLVSLLNIAPVGGEKGIETKCPEFLQFKKSLQQVTVSSTNIEILEPFIDALFGFAKEWRDDYVAYKKSNHLITHNDMERLFLQLLTDEDKKEAQDYIRENYKLLMVDEFQDSNPIQLKIFNRLSDLIGEKEGHSYWVGDPKQAIYGFRGADTELVNLVAGRFTMYEDDIIHDEEGNDKLGSGRLVESWRSRPELVELVNSVFYGIFRGEINEYCIKLTPHYKNCGLDIAPIKHWNTTISYGISDMLAYKVRNLLESGIQVHGGKLNEPVTVIRPKDIAVLCRTNSEVKKVVAAMRKYGVPVADAEENIMQRIEVQLAVALLQFVQDPTDKYTIANLFRLLWDKAPEDILADRIRFVMDCIDENGNYDYGKDNWKTEASEVLSLKKLTERFRYMSIPEMVRALIYECNLPALSARWSDHRVRQQNLSVLQHLADDYDQMCLQMGLGSSVSGFVNYLDTVKFDPQNDNQSDTVKVFTYHGAKGLEWSVVILNGLGDDVLADKNCVGKTFMDVKEVELLQNGSGSNLFDKRYYLHYFPHISVDPTNAQIDHIKQLELYKNMLDRNRKEERRLMYVGMTRAKDCLISSSERDNMTWLRNIGIESPECNPVWGVKDPSMKPETENIGGVPSPAGGAANYTLEQKPQAHTDRSDRYCSPSKLEQFDGYTGHAEWSEHGPEMGITHWKAEIDVVGSCIHQIFEIYKHAEKLDDAVSSNRAAAERVIREFGLAKKLGDKISAILTSAHWLHGSLQAKYPQQQGDKLEREVPFMMAIDGNRILSGEIDMLWHYTEADGRKRCVLVDYKTTTDSRLDAQSRTHYAQLSAYAKALNDAGIDVAAALLYYPASATIHELK